MREVMSPRPKLYPKKLNNPPQKGFKWKDSQGNFWKPEEMETSHLFHVLNMIWNHSMPEDARSPNYRKYAFGPFYSPNYMKEALRNIIPELLSRNDLIQTWKDRLNFMREYLKKPALPSVESRAG